MHMGSHSVACHPTQVNTPRLNTLSEHCIPSGSRWRVGGGSSIHLHVSQTVTIRNVIHRLSIRAVSSLIRCIGAPSLRPPSLFIALTPLYSASRHGADPIQSGSSCLIQTARFRPPSRSNATAAGLFEPRPVRRSLSCAALRCYRRRFIRLLRSRRSIHPVVYEYVGCDHTYDNGILVLRVYSSVYVYS